MMARDQDRSVPWQPCLWVALMGPVGLCLLWVARGHPDAVEVWFSRGAFPRIQGLLAGAHGFLPFSLSEALLAVMVLLCSYWACAGLCACLLGRRGLWNLVLRGAALSLAFSGVAVLSFFLLWGLNHARPSLAALAGLDTQPATQAELRGLAERLEEAALEALSAGARSGSRPGGVDWDAGDGGPELQAAWKLVALRLPFLAGPSPRLRSAKLSPVLSWLGLSGVYSPFTGEPHVNSEMPEPAWAFTASHEVAHQRGVAGEDEANFISWLVCRESANAGHRYSGSLQALSYALAAWYREHPIEAQAAIGALDPRILEDLRSLQGFWDSKRGRASDLAMVGHDAILKGLGHEQGVRSYGGMVDLMIAWGRSLSE